MSQRDIQPNASTRPLLWNCGQMSAMGRCVRLVLACVALCIPQSAPAASLAHAPTPAHWLSDIGLFSAGALGAFVAHESGHLLANAAVGNRPSLVPVPGLLGIPFFAISPGIQCHPKGCIRANGRPFAYGRRGQFFIAAAGFNVQHAGSEIVLSLYPRLRYRDAPFAKGLLAFNVLLSVGYAVASVAHIEDPHGDAGGCAGHAHWPRAAIASMLLAPAVAGGLRYWFPDATQAWLPWVSRGSKGAFFGVAWLF